MYQLLQEYICIRISNTAGREWLTCTACGVLVWRIYRRLFVVYYLIPSSKMPQLAMLFRAQSEDGSIRGTENSAVKMI